MELLKMSIVIFLTPVYIIKYTIMQMVDLLLPVSEGIGEGLNKFYNSMYEFWKKIFKWK